MNIETLKEVLGDEKFAELKSHIDDLAGQRDAARNESINGRKTLKQQVADLTTANASLMEKLGIESIDQIDQLPDANGAAEAAKQYEAKVKRLERQHAEAGQQRDEAIGKHRSSLQRAMLADAMGGHDFLARDVVETYIGRNLAWEGEELLYKADDGRLIPVKDAVAGIAKSRPELLKSTGAGGAGVRPAQAGSTGTVSTMTRAEFEAMPPAKRVELSKAGVQLT